MSEKLLAEFETPEALLEAARRIVRDGHRPLDAFTPFPVEDIEQAIPIGRTRLPAAMLIGGLVTAALAFAMQWYSAVVDYPLNVGGRPLDSWPVFLLVPFEVGMLLAALSGFVAFLWSCGLPRLHDPLFALPSFERATQDRFFLLAEAAPKRAAGGLRRAFEQSGAAAVTTVPP